VGTKDRTAGIPVYGTWGLPGSRPQTVLRQIHRLQKTVPDHAGSDVMISGGLISPLQQLAQPPPYTALAFLLVPAPVARRVQRVLRHRTQGDLPEFVQGRDHLPSVPGLDCMVPGDAIRDVFHEPPLDLLPGHLLEAEREGGNPQPVCCIGAHGHCSRSPHDGECTAVIDPVDHPGHPLFLRGNGDIGLDRRFPCGFVAGRNAEAHEVLHRRINRRADSSDLAPDRFRFKRVAEMV